MPPKAKLIETHTAVGRKICAKSSQIFSDPSGARNTFGAGWQTRLVNGTVIAVHESTSENNRKNITVDSRLIFRSHSPPINQ